MANSSGTDRIDLIHKLGKDFRERAAEHDRDDSFVKENYAALRSIAFLRRLSRKNSAAAHMRKRLQMRIAKAVQLPGFSNIKSYGGLSRGQGNSLARFLGGSGAEASCSTRSYLTL